MVHVLPSPGAPGHTGRAASRRRAREDAKALLDAGFDGLLVENMHDFPPLREVEMGPETPAWLAVLAAEIRDHAPAEIPVGVQVLFAAHRVATAVLVAAGLDFLRAEAWTYGHLADKGWVEASAGTTLRYGRALGADPLVVWADAKKKHASHAATADLSLEEIARGLALHGARACILSGPTTGVAPDPDDFARLRGTVDLPLVLGSGLTVQNAPSFREAADALIVGTAAKIDGKWANPVDPRRARELVAAVHGS
jgi:membrane complex biogenesis BtpA family protein